jgi:uncharacterized protein (DUF2236 family)
VSSSQTIPPQTGLAGPVPPFRTGVSSPAMWRITREQVLLLGGPSAAILQIAHPTVALGVAHHSDFRADTLGRLRRTLDAIYTITFCPRTEVEAMAARVRAAHRPVRGETPRRYSAFSPDAQLWVLATLIRLSVEMFERFVGPIPLGEREDFFRGMREFGTWFGLPADYGPQDWAGFTAYYEGMLSGDLLGSLPVSREIARHIVYPQKPVILRTLWPLSSVVAREFLPSPLREKLGLPSTLFSRWAAASLDILLPRVLPVLPPQLRFAPHYVRAMERGARI